MSIKHLKTLMVRPPWTVISGSVNVGVTDADISGSPTEQGEQVTLYITKQNFSTSWGAVVELLLGHLPVTMEAWLLIQLPAKEVPATHVRQLSGILGSWSSWPGI